MTSTIINGIFVQNSFLQGLEMEKAKKLKIYIKLVNIKIMLVSGVLRMKSVSTSYLAWPTAYPPVFP